MSEEVKFPIYRKYHGDRTFFKVTSYTTFEELNIIGKYYRLEHFHARILPDRNYIMDMIENRESNWEISSEKEFEYWKAYCPENLQKLD